MVEVPSRTGHIWVRAGENRPTESSAFDVIDERKLRGTAKPGCKIVHVRHAAHEKIASDLAALLALSVPPVTLYQLAGTLPDCPHKKLPGDPFVAISAWPFLSFEEWGGRINNKMTEEQKQSRIGPISAMWVFDTWISAREDRGPKHTLVNSMLGNNPIGLAFIDYAFSLSKFWSAPDSPLGAAPWWYADIRKDEAVVRHVAEQISQIDDAVIAQIVNQIPEEWLPKAIGMGIVANLQSRKTKIHTLLGL